MSTISNSLAPRGEVPAGAFFRTIGSILKSWWAAYINWRLEHLAIVRLQAMSDRQLKDIGVSRAAIEFAVKGGSGSHPLFKRHY